MKTNRPTFGLLVLGAATLLGCGEDDSVSCTTDIKPALSVKLNAPEDFPVDRVTAERERKQECGATDAPDDPKAARSFSCAEQGEGEYVVRVHSGTKTWTKTVDVVFDGCHPVQPPESVAFDLTLQSADDE